MFLFLRQKIIVLFVKCSVINKTFFCSFSGEYGTKRKPWFIFQKSFWVEDRSKFYQVMLDAEIEDV